MNLDTKKRLVDQLKRHEQSNRVALTPYRCPAGKLTIGWGHNYEDKPLIPYIAEYLKVYKCITEVMANRQLLRDVEDAEIDAVRHCKVYERLDDVRQAVLVNMIFNLGDGFIVEGSKHYWPNFNKALNALDYNAAAKAMYETKWYRQLGGDPHGTNDGVLERPEELIDMMMTGKWKEIG